MIWKLSVSILCYIYDNIDFFFVFLISVKKTVEKYSHKSDLSVLRLWNSIKSPSLNDLYRMLSLSSYFCPIIEEMLLTMRRDNPVNCTSHLWCCSIRKQVCNFIARFLHLILITDFGSRTFCVQQTGDLPLITIILASWVIEKILVLMRSIAIQYFLCDALWTS